MLARILSMPVMFSVWGPLKTGEWLMLSAIPLQFAMISNLGISSVTAIEIAAAVEQKQLRKASYIYTESGKVVLAACLTVGTLLSLAFWAMRSRLQGIAPAENVLLIVGALLAAMLIRQLANTFHALLRATGYLDASIYLAGSMQIAFLVLGIFYGVGMLKIGLGALAVVAVVIAFSELAIVACLGSWLGAGVRFSTTRFRSKRIKRLLKRSTGYLGLPTLETLSNQGLLLLAGVLGTPESAAVFAAIRTPNNIARQAATALGQSFEPELARIRSNKNRLTSLHKKLRLLTLVAIALIAIVFVFLGEWVFELLTSGKAVFDGPTFWCVYIATAIHALWLADARVLLVLKNYRPIVVAYAVGITVAAISAPLLFPTLQLFGIAVSLLLIHLVAFTLIQLKTPRTSQKSLVVEI